MNSGYSNMKHLSYGLVSELAVLFGFRTEDEPEG